MTAPSVEVLIGFAATGTLGNYFTLNDPTAGLLSSPPTPPTYTSTYTLGGTVYVDVSNLVSGQLSITRGRSRQTDQFQAGTASFTLRNEDRSFDPSNTSSPYWPNVGPRAEVQISIAGQRVFTGYTDDVSVSYEMPNVCTTTFTCIDAFTLLANMPVDGLHVTSALPGAVISQVLDYVGFPATRQLDTGNTYIQDSRPTGDALQYLQAVSASENGYLYIDRYGVLTFIDRYGVTIHGVPALIPQSVTFTDSTSDPDLAVGQCGYSQITQASQALLLYNIVTGSTDGGTSGVGISKTATNAASVSKYFGRTLSLSSLQSALASDVTGLCSWLVNLYSTPEVRFETIGVELSGVIDSRAITRLRGAANLAAFDIGQAITVERTPPGTGTPSTISIGSVIEGISYSLDASSSSYQATYALGSNDRLRYFILDDADQGVLDSSHLAY